ncbi:MAG: hypothetical protein E7645_00840 [Ruminococcaceae bacterium]|nr:hypothetical protein [Oscillospiraceae bacterium]
MANKRDGKEIAENKASSLLGDGLSSLTRNAGAYGKRGKGHKETAVVGKKKFPWKSLIVDVILLVILCGVGVGAFWGYHTVKNMYMPTWQEKEIEFCVEIPDVEKGRANQLLSVLEGKKLWHSGQADGDTLGIISDAGYDPGSEDNVINLILTVKTTAEYRKGEGYYINSTRILAGETTELRTEGFVGEGVVLYVRDLSEASS